MKFKLGTGDKGVQKYISIQREMVPHCMRQFMTEYYRLVTTATPVDTGRARWGWNCSIGNADLTVPPEGKYRLEATRAAKVFTVEAVDGEKPLYIANAVPYIGQLNNGKSRQAPARFVELAFESAFGKLEKYVAVKGYADK